MTNDGRLDPDAVLPIFEQIEEMLAGLAHLEKRGIFDKDMMVAFVHTLTAAVQVIDLYLTGNVENRGKKDILEAIPILAGQSWTMNLSDGISAVVFRKPTKEDRCLAFLDERDPENPPDAETKILWETLMAKKRPPSKFPITDGLFE